MWSVFGYQLIPELIYIYNARALLSIRNIQLKNAIKTLISKDTILDIPIDGIFKMAGESNIKTFVQIGSNDGRKNDPLNHYIRKNGWKGILVEPDLALSHQPQ